MGTFQTMSLRWNLEIMDAWAVWGLWLKVDNDVPEDTHFPYAPNNMVRPKSAAS